jgi:O-antigen/teichoic acid export membrane protein
VLASLFSICAKVGAALCSFLAVYLIAHRFGAAGLGVFGIGQTILSICVVLGAIALELGSLRSVAVLNAQGDRAGLRSWTRSATLTLAGGTVLVATVAGLASGELAALFTNAPGGAATLVFLCLARPLIALSRLFAAFLRAVELVAVGSLCDPLLASAGFVVLILLLHPATLPDAALAYAGGAALAALFGAFACASAFRARDLLCGPGPLAMRTAIRTSLPLYGSQINGFAVEGFPSWPSGRSPRPPMPDCTGSRRRS